MFLTSSHLSQIAHLRIISVLSFPEWVATTNVVMFLQGASQAATVNAKYAAALTSARAVLQNHPLFTDLHKELPSALISQAAFEQKDFKAAISASKVYKCGGNAFWAKVEVSDSVPISDHLLNVACYAYLGASSGLLDSAHFCCDSFPMFYSGSA